MSKTLFKQSLIYLKKEKNTFIRKLLNSLKIFNFFATRIARIIENFIA